MLKICKNAAYFSAVAIALNYYEGVTRVKASNKVENCTNVGFGSKEIEAPPGWCKMPVIHFFEVFSERFIILKSFPIVLTKLKETILKVYLLFLAKIQFDKLFTIFD